MMMGRGIKTAFKGMTPVIERMDTKLKLWQLDTHMGELTLQRICS